MNNQQNTLRATSEYMEANHAIAHHLFHYLSSLNRQFLLRSELLDAFKALCKEDCPELCDSPLARLIHSCQEAALDTSWIYLALRPRIASWMFVRIHLESLHIESITVAEFLRFKERLAAGTSEDDWVLEFDLAPFSREFYKLREANSIGRGVEFLNRRLSSRLFEELGKGDKRLLAFLQVHRYRDQQLMLNENIEDVSDLRNAIRQADGYLQSQPQDKPWEDMYPELRSYGFEPGWGNDVARIRNTMQLLLDILEAPAPNNLEDFLSRIPMIFSMAILSPHGYFGQANVLGRPDTGGQVVYILDQVRALEKEMRDRLLQQGLNIEPQIVVLTRLIPNAEGTTCNERLEPIVGTHNARILRVPFRSPDGEIIPHWISRFEIWPYLEQYAIEAERELLAELSGRPDLIVGNYSDGNLVASLMSQRLGIT
jgi:sucrose synthase